MYINNIILKCTQLFFYQMQCANYVFVVIERSTPTKTKPIMISCSIYLNISNINGIRHNNVNIAMQRFIHLPKRPLNSGKGDVNILSSDYTILHGDPENEYRLLLYIIMTLNIRRDCFACSLTFMYAMLCYFKLLNIKKRQQLLTCLTLIRFYFLWFLYSIKHFLPPLFFFSQSVLHLYYSIILESTGKVFYGCIRYVADHYCSNLYFQKVISTLPSYSLFTHTCNYLNYPF